jgi:hypothetical protein
MQPMAWQWRCHAVLKKGRLMQATHGGPVTAVKDRMHAFSSSAAEASNSRRRVRRRRPAASCWTLLPGSPAGAVTVHARSNTSRRQAHARGSHTQGCDAKEEEGRAEVGE